MQRPIISVKIVRMIQPPLYYEVAMIAWAIGSPLDPPLAGLFRAVHPSACRPSASHWLHQESPDAVHKALLHGTAHRTAIQDRRNGLPGRIRKWDSLSAQGFYCFAMKSGGSRATPLPDRFGGACFPMLPSRITYGYESNAQYPVGSRHRAGAPPHVRHGTQSSSVY
jgi:hypothetical protein